MGVRKPLVTFRFSFRFAPPFRFGSHPYSIRFVVEYETIFPAKIWLAILINGLLEDWLNFAVLMVLQFVNGIISYNEATKAGDAIAALKASLKASAAVKRAHS